MTARALLSRRSRTGADLLNQWIAGMRLHPPAPGTRFSLLALARELGVARQNLNAWRRGEQCPTDEHAKKLAALTKNAVPSSSWHVETR